MKEVQLKSTKGDISKISSLMTYLYFLLVKIHREENIFLTEIYDRECLHLFSIRKSFLNSLEICDALQLDLKNRH